MLSHKLKLMAPRSTSYLAYLASGDHARMRSGLFQTSHCVLTTAHKTVNIWAFCNSQTSNSHYRAVM